MLRARWKKEIPGIHSRPTLFYNSRYDLNTVQNPYIFGQKWVGSLRDENAQCLPTGISLYTGCLASGAAATLSPRAGRTPLRSTKPPAKRASHVAGWPAKTLSDRYKASEFYCLP